MAPEASPLLSASFPRTPRQIIELHDCVFRKPLVQIVGQRFRSRIITGVGKRERGKILQIAAARELQCQSGASPRFVSVAEPCFSQSGDARVEGRCVLLSGALGVIHRASAEFAGVFKVPGIGGSIAFHTQHFPPQLRESPQLCNVLGHPRRIVLRECKLIHDGVDERGM